MKKGEKRRPSRQDGSGSDATRGQDLSHSCRAQQAGIVRSVEERKISAGINVPEPPWHCSSLGAGEDNSKLKTLEKVAWADQIFTAKGSPRARLGKELKRL